MIERVTRSKVKPIPREILGEKILINTNAVEVAVEDDTLWEYDQKQYTKDEYIQKMDLDNQELDGVVTDLTQLLMDKGVIF
jgi:hypothetical protein